MILHNRRSWGKQGRLVLGKMGSGRLVLGKRAWDKRALGKLGKMGMLA